jgi:sec-independent protein translocase protein TatA
MGAMSPTHWLIVIGVLVVLFGAKKLPQMARSVGQSARVFKGEMKGLREDEQAAAAPAEIDPATGATAAPATAQAERPAA